MSVVPHEVARADGYTADPAVAAGTVLVAELDTDKPFPVSFDPAVLLEL